MIIKNNQTTKLVVTVKYTYVLDVKKHKKKILSHHFTLNYLWAECGPIT